MAVSERHYLQVDDEILDAATRSDSRIDPSQERPQSETATTSDASKRAAESAAVGPRTSSQVQETSRHAAKADGEVVIVRNEETPWKQGVFVRASGQSRTDDDGITVRFLTGAAPTNVSLMAARGIRGVPKRNRLFSGCHGHGFAWPCFGRREDKATQSRDRGTQNTIHKPVAANPSSRTASHSSSKSASVRSSSSRSSKSSRFSASATRRPFASSRSA